MSKKYCGIGGQALIEGVMMRGTKSVAMAVRKPDGEIEIKKEILKIDSGKKISKIPFVRGTFALISSMIVGIKALTYSAEFFAVEEEVKPSKFEDWINKKLGDKAENALIIFSMITAGLFAFGLFGVLPTILTNFFKANIDNHWVLAAIEGITKIILFVTYILVISNMKDIKRVFQYHGAEHKTIHCLESGGELTPENAQKFSRLHPRCGTSFILFVLVISILVFSFVSWNSILGRIGLKILLFPVIAGISYEIIKWAGKSEGKFVSALSYPGLMLQKLTTKEPDYRQLEVAIAAINGVLEDEEKQSE
jgi:uncharacterized protein YqhQ